MKTTLSLGYSTCPNDTFLFYALAHKKIDLGGLAFNIQLADVETLNQQAEHGDLDVTKLSFAALGHFQETYGLLRTGAALGKGCGPLIVAKPGIDISSLSDFPIAIPGLKTTAAMLLFLFLSDLPRVVPMTFDKIMPAIQRGDFKAGVIIHEGRFTYKKFGLVCLQDLGEWWETKLGLPIPLGGIAIRRDVPKDVIRSVESAIRESVRFSNENPEASRDYMCRHAAEMDLSVMDQHIRLYVNDYTVSLGKEGEKAVNALFSLGRERKIIPDCRLSVFAV